MKLNSDVDRIF